ncbi:hypothetical protein BUALT_Bualt01G0023000 [Buddleja alternifolia]|uniref:Uncharacterized protein n=1 Tax=Buddleja alternifolia TaxID=168488 RepID=A0AAV6Y623_9LAMI|nr:hypothetical protein BUALT_Bualt01G0023000 [Buddleja alternifolia]
MGILPSPPPFLRQPPPPPPPLLPLPTTYPLRSTAAYPPPNNNTNRRRNPSTFIPKKSKSPTKNHKKGEIKRSSDCVNIVSSRTYSTMGPDPVDMVTGSAVFTTISPPPSSLPLPSFCLRPKLMISCNAKAAGVDTGATNNLRQQYFVSGEYAN